MLWQVSHENAYRQDMSCCFQVVSCHVMSRHVTEGSHREQRFVVKRFSTCVLKHSEAPICLPIPRHPILQTRSQQTKLHLKNKQTNKQTAVTDCSRTEWHCCHRQTVLGLNDNSVTNCSWTDQCSSHIRLHGLNDTAATNRLFMDWMILWSQTDCSWTELWHCSHKQTFHELNDTVVTNRLFMDCVMILQSQTDCSWTEWHCSHKQTAHGLNDTAVTDSSWTQLCCGHKQNVHGLNYDTAVTNRLFMDSMMTMQSQTDCSWTDQCSSHIRLHELNDVSPSTFFR